MNKSNIPVDLNLLDLWAVLKGRKKMIAVVVVSLTLFGFVYSLVLPKTYKAKATIIALEGGSEGFYVDMLNEIRDEFGLGVDKVYPRDRLVVILKSRTLAEKIIDKYDLIPVLLYKTRLSDNVGEASEVEQKMLMEKAVEKLLEERVSFGSIRDKGVIEISAEFGDSELAARVVNGYLEELGRIVAGNDFASAKKNRISMQEQLIKNEKELLASGKKLNEFYKGKNISNTGSQVDVRIAEYAFSNGSNFSKVSEDNLEDLLKKKEEIKDVMVVKDVPQQVYLQYLLAYRNVLTRVNVLLAQGYEAAKIKEDGNLLSFEIVDPAKVSWQRYSPKRTEIVILFFMISVYIGVCGAFLADYIAMAGKNHIVF